MGSSCAVAAGPQNPISLDGYLQLGGEKTIAFNPLELQKF
jgi:hypothetical protein